MDKTSGQIVAIKIVELDLSNEELAAIQKEIAVLCQVRSPYITKYYDSFVHDSQLWIVMEFCAGRSCADIIKGQPMSEAQIAAVLRDVLHALAYLHIEGKIHRDIKAANVLLNGTGHVRLADFGVAGQLQGPQKRDRAFVGTPYWMSPEVIKQSGYDTKADIWSVGILAYELSQGQPPYADLHPMKVLHLIPRNPPPQLPRSCSKDLRDFVEKCTTRDPLRRPSAAAMLQHRLIRCAADPEILRPLVTRRPTANVPSRRRRAPMGDVSNAPMWEFGSLVERPKAPASSNVDDAPSKKPALWGTLLSTARRAAMR